MVIVLECLLQLIEALDSSNTHTTCELNSHIVVHNFEINVNNIVKKYIVFDWNYRFESTLENLVVCFSSH